MKRYVFLSELDSAAGADINRLGLRCMFEEITLHGNSIVLSMNQLTDSRLTHEMIRSEYVRNCVLALFSKGVLSYVREPNARTPCQYLLNVIKRAMSPDAEKEGFIFSFECLNEDTAVPRIVMLETLRDALTYSDPELIRDVTKPYGVDEVQVENLTRYVELILRVSESDLAHVDVQDQPLGLRKFIEILIDNQEVFTDEDVAGAIRNLEHILVNYPDSNLGARSVWYKLLEKEGCFGDAEKKVIDICYNYKQEDLALGVSRHYIREEAVDVSFFEDFHERYERVSNPPKVNSDWKMDWESLVRVVYRGNRVERMKPAGDAEVYEIGFTDSNSRWLSLRRRTYVRSMISPVVFVLIFIVVTAFMNDIVDKYGITSDIRIVDALWSFPPVIVSLLADKILSITFKYPGISESLHMLYIGLKDHWSVNSRHSPVFHYNSKLMEREEQYRK